MTTPDHEPEQLADEAVAAEAAETTEAVAETSEAVAETSEADAVAEFDAAVEADDEGDAEPVPAPVALPNRLIQTVGRRKEAIVRVRLVPGSGKFTLNGKSLEQYFPNKVHQQLIKEPLVTVERVEMFDVIGNLVGGGISGQAGALRLAIARALIEFESEDRPALKKAGFLTRDPRAKERKKYGLKKARKAPQYSKR
ncbi:30S ribosomal protein S9 [Kutzneria sp. CA-103260]|uniref:30S ribosomal protein S9 n=1 Tax=Kutzneria sp. CA-103260 TaxID=2802641 RepID=UPI001BF107DC|nr:30S ribosomal protein S9 [Kutzneria sp. CA-103260]QUQ70679.1 30S ribosomal protein S9 [Kutzneria sp. CA-103260]